MRVLVTGGAGFIGSNLAAALRDRGDEVRVLDSLLNSTPDRVPDGVEFHERDLRDGDAVRAACEGVEVVFHQGALRSPMRSVEDPIPTTECNVIGTLNVLVAATAARVRRVVYASSSSVYGHREGEPQREDDPTDPMSPYAASKLAGEQYCSVWTKTHGLSTVGLRYFNVFGPRQNPESRYSAVFPAFTAALLDERAPEVHWDGEQSRDFTFIDDVVAANLAAASADDRVDGAVVNVAGGEPKTIIETLKAVSEAVGTWIEPTYLPKRPGDIRHSRADLSRAEELLGYRPEAVWDEAVAATVAWLRDR